MRKILGIDIETTGLDAKRHGIIQIGMFIDIDGKLEDTLLVNVQPFDDDYIFCEDCKSEDNEFPFEDISYIPTITIDSVAKPSNIKLIDIANNHIPPKKALQQIIAFLDKHISKFDKTDKAYLMGFNIKFDMDFMGEWFRKLDFKYFGSYTNYRPLDAYYEACSWAYIGGFNQLENLKLETLCKAYSIEIEAHNALSDILATRELWYKLVGFHTVEEFRNGNTNPI